MSDPRLWLTTERLALRRFTTADLDWLATLYSDADVMRYVGGPTDRAKVTELLNVRILEYYDVHPELGIWMTIERSTGTALGLHLLNHIQGESLIQVGFFLSKPAWGRGFGTEMALALLRYGFVDLALPRIVGMTALDNRASERVLLKIFIGTASEHFLIRRTRRPDHRRGSNATRSIGYGRHPGRRGSSGRRFGDRLHRLSS